VARRNNLVQHSQWAVTGTWLSTTIVGTGLDANPGHIPPSDPALALVIHIFSDSAREFFIK